MANFYNSASFILIAGAYKDNKVYAVKPTDGSGDITYTSRGTSGSRINSNNLVEQVGPNTIRLDYDLNSCPSFLFEKQRTNLLSYSNTFNNAAWTTSSATITASVITSPSGTLDGWKLDETNVTNYHFVSRSNFGNFINQSTYVCSAFVKPAERTRVAIETNLASAPGSGDVTKFNLTGTGSVIVSGSGVTGSITPVSGGWYRISVKGTRAISTTAGYFGIMTVSGSNSAISYTGAPGNGVYIYGAQVESGSYLTSYIPTTTATVTRNGDYALRIPTPSDPYNFTLFHVGTFNDTSDPVDGYLGQSICILSGSTSFPQWRWLGFSGTTGRGQYNIDGGNFGYNNLNSSRVTPNVEHKMLIKLENNSTASWFVDGTKIGSVPFSIAGTWDYIALNGRSYNDASSNEAPARYRIVAVIPSALSDADCITLTT
jgi:hypothetical protein